MKYVLFIFLAMNTFATTYYVRTDGNNGNPGTTDSSGGAWATPYFAVPMLANGDTLIIGPGTFADYAHSGLVNDGTNNLTIIGYTNMTTIAGAGFYFSGTNINIGWLTISNLTYNKSVDGAAVILNGSHHSFIHDLVIRDSMPDNYHYGVYWFYSGVGSPSIVPIGAPASSCLVSNIVITNCNQIQCFVFAGTNNLITHCTLVNLDAADIFWGCGKDNVFEQSYVAGLYYTSGNHPDLMQTGSQVNWTSPVSSSNPLRDSYHNIFRYNQVWDCPGVSFGQLNTDDTNSPPVTLVSDWEVYNNLFVRVGNQGSIDIPNYLFANNTLIECCTNSGTSAGHPIYLTFNKTPESNGDFRGCPTNAVIVNNDFLGCGYNTNNGWVTIDNDYQIATNTWNLTFSNNFVVHWTGSGWLRKTYLWQTNLFGGSQKDNYTIPADINSGADPHLVCDNLDNILYASHCQPVFGSSIIDAGATRTDNPVNDFYSVARPLGAKIDIGCFEFDPNLVMHFDFDENPIASNMVYDTTGYGHNAVQMDPTNFCKLTNSIDGTMASLGVIVAQVPDNNYNYTWYGAITNLNTGAASRIDFITNGTFSSWVQMGATGERWDTILDAGEPPSAAITPGLATNSWSVHYGYADLREPTCTNFIFKVYGTNSANDLHDPALMLPWPQLLRDGSTWGLLTATWQGGNNITLYFNGQPVSTNSFTTVPWLRVSGSPAEPWMALNIQTHGGTPQWGDSDIYPNYGALKGSLDDVRLYNRMLSASEVANLYAPASIPTTTGGGANNPTPATGLIIIGAGNSTFKVGAGNSTFTMMH